jgi:hypothetical protein
MRNALAIGTALAALWLVGAAGAAADTTIATATSGQVRVTLVAHELAGAPPTARVTVTTYRRAQGRWLRVANSRLRGTYFGRVVRAPHALCRLQLATAGAAHPHVTVQLLVTPSIGCGQRQVLALPA